MLSTVPATSDLYTRSSLAVRRSRQGTSEVGRWLLVWVGSIVTLGRGFVVFSCFLPGSSGQRPPIEPDVRFSRIRLPEVVHCVACACR